MTKLSMFGPSSPAGTVPGRRARRFALLALWGLTGVGLLTGCAGREGGSNFNFLTTPAYGRPDTCPDDAVDPGGPGGGPMAARCSYANASGEMMQLRGSVLLEVSGSGIPRPAEGMRVIVSDDAGKQVGRTTSDAQGRFTVGLSQPPGAYVLRVVATDTGAVLTERSVVVPEGARTVNDLDLVLPLDPTLR